MTSFNGWESELRWDSSSERNDTKCHLMGGRASWEEIFWARAGGMFWARAGGMISCHLLVDEENWEEIYFRHVR